MWVCAEGTEKVLSLKYKRMVYIHKFGYVPFLLYLYGKK